MDDRPLVRVSRRRASVRPGWHARPVISAVNKDDVFLIGIIKIPIKPLKIITLISYKSSLV